MADSDGFESADEEASGAENNESSTEMLISESPSTPTKLPPSPTNSSHTPPKESPTPIKLSPSPSLTQSSPTPPACSESLSQRPMSPDIKPDPATPELPPQDVWGWGGWSTWAATSVSSVAEMASKTKKELSGALETFEATLGLPTPEDLAREIKEENEIMESKKETNEEKKEDDAQNPENESDKNTEGFGYYPGTGFWTGLSSLSATSSQYLATGLETLEKVSNQAFDALNDPLADSDKPKARARDSTKGANLMSVLQEAKSKYEQHEKISAETKRTMSYLFDDKQGLSQLEALEMLSKECVHKMKNHPTEGNSLFVYIETSLELKGGDSELIIEQLGAAVADCLKTLKLDLPITKLNQCRYEVGQQLIDSDMSTMDETAKPSDVRKAAVLDSSLSSIAAFAARSVELFKKIAELSLLKSSLEVDMKTQSDTIKFLNEVLCCEIENIREQFERKMENKGDVDVLYLETSNAVSYVQETLYFFIPILKWVVVKTSKC